VVLVPFVMLPLALSFPPVPAAVVGLTFFSAFEDAFLYASRVLGPDLLK
jgi:hypothetical protein